MTVGKISPNEAARGWRNATRQRLIAAREALPADVHARHSAEIERLLEPLLQKLAPRVIGFCWPHRAEFDCRPLIQRWLKQAGHAAALPVVIAPDQPLIFRAWQAVSRMSVDRYGIHFPTEGASLHPDLILMPLNGFDEAGYRLGYGGGYFDRTLALLVPRPLAVGVGFELARLESIHPQAHDLPVDFVVTEAGAARRGEESWKK